MPKITRALIKASLVYFVLALLAGVFLAAQNLGTPGLQIGGVFPVYLHLLVIGWITQLIFGVAVWMFPKFTVAQPRRSDRLTWFCFYTLNSGLALRMVAEPMLAASAAPAWTWLMVASATLLLASGVAFVINTWQRVKEH